LRPVSREGFAPPQAHGCTCERSGENVARLSEASLAVFESGEPPITPYLEVERRSPSGITRRRVYRKGSMDDHRSVEATGAPTHGATLRPLPVVVIHAPPGTPRSSPPWWLTTSLDPTARLQKYRFSVVEAAIPYSAKTIAEHKPLPSRIYTGATSLSPGRAAVSYDHGYDDQLESLKADCEVRTGLPAVSFPPEAPRSLSERLPAPLFSYRRVRGSPSLQRERARM
jgi:hypothetical protein